MPDEYPLLQRVSVHAATRNGSGLTPAPRVIQGVVQHASII